MGSNAGGFLGTRADNDAEGKAAGTTAQVSKAQEVKHWDSFGDIYAEDDSDKVIDLKPRPIMRPVEILECKS